MTTSYCGQMHIYIYQKYTAYVKSIDKIIFAMQSAE